MLDYLHSHNYDQLLEAWLPSFSFPTDYRMLVAGLSSFCFPMVYAWGLTSLILINIAISLWLDHLCSPLKPSMLEAGLHSHKYCHVLEVASPFAFPIVYVWGWTTFSLILSCAWGCTTFSLLSNGLCLRLDYLHSPFQWSVHEAGLPSLSPRFSKKKRGYCVITPFHPSVMSHHCS